MAKVQIKSEKPTPFGGFFFDYGAILCSFGSNYRFHLGIEQLGITNNKM